MELVKTDQRLFREERGDWKPEEEKYSIGLVGKGQIKTDNTNTKTTAQPTPLNATLAKGTAILPPKAEIKPSFFNSAPKPQIRIPTTQLNFRKP